MNPIDQVYDRLKSLFGEGDDQVMVLEFPGRVLNEDTFRYETGSIYSNMNKPQPVLEAEFRLTDDLYDVVGDPSDRHITGGPSQEKLSKTFDMVLGGLVPMIDELEEYDEDKVKMQQWLLEHIDDQIDSNHTCSGSRMGFYTVLLER